MKNASPMFYSHCKRILVFYYAYNRVYIFGSIVAATCGCEISATHLFYNAVIEICKVTSRSMEYDDTPTIFESLSLENIFLVCW